MKPSRTVLRLLGSPSLTADDGSLLTGRATQRHRLALLALLALAPDQRLSREKLVTYLWPESEPERGRNLLNVSSYVLRAELGEQSILTVGEDLRLNLEAVQVDVHEFEETIARGDLAGAIALYRGPLLDGFFVAGAAEFERWASRERDRLAGAYRQALEALAEAAEREGDGPAAVGWWKARAAADPYDSRVTLRLMHAMERNGNRAGALQQAAVHRLLLEQEFGIPPAAEVLALVERLQQERPRPDPADADPLADRPGPDEASLVAPPSPSPATATSDDAGTSNRAAPVPVAGTDSPSRAPAPDATPRRSRRPGGVLRWAAGALLVGAIAFGASRLRTFRGAANPPVQEPSIAVLPLTSLSSDPRDAALADGLTEELIAVLARTEGLRVMASTSAFMFRDRALDVRRIADSLRVEHVLEGGFQKSGSRLRVRVRLVDGRDGSTRWSQIYDRELRDVFAVQDEIARSVARELGVRLGAVAGPPARRPQTRSIAAYELYLRGSDGTLLRNDSAAREGLAYFRRAVALDSSYAAAWAGLARMYARVGEPGMSRFERIALAEAAARKALALDDSLAEGHATLAVIRMFTFDFGTAERHLERAIELDPARGLTHEWMVTLRLWTGQPAEALAHARHSLELDPLSPYAHAEMARALIGNGRCDQALEHLEQLRGLEPPLARATPLTAQAHACSGRWTEAIATLRPRARSAPSPLLAQLGFMMARAGQREEALRIRDILFDRWRRGNGGAFEIALVHAGLGDLDQTFPWLDRALADGSLNGAPGDPAPLMLMGPLLEEVRSDPRFERLRERLGLRR